jgi:hypothetical protein
MSLEKRYEECHDAATSQIAVLCLPWLIYGVPDKKIEMWVNAKMECWRRKNTAKLFSLREMLSQVSSRHHHNPQARPAKSSTAHLTIRYSIQYITTHHGLAYSRRKASMCVITRSAGVGNSFSHNDIDNDEDSFFTPFLAALYL